jgi:hypothetical protein
MIIALSISLKKLKPVRGAEITDLNDMYLKEGNS